MKKFHLAILTDDIAATVQDYSHRLSAQPCVVVDGEYALWRTEMLNISVRKDVSIPKAQSDIWGGKSQPPQNLQQRLIRMVLLGSTLPQANKLKR